MDKKSLAQSLIPTAVAIFAVVVGTDNVWNSPDFDIKVSDISKNEDGVRPVDELVRVIYGDIGNTNLTAEWLRNRDVESLCLIEDRFSSEDAWILDRIYYNPDVNGLSHKIIIKNYGNIQAHDVIIQILGRDNFKIIDYTCPEIMSNEQITKEFGKKYIIAKSRMSVKLECEIIINSVGNERLDRVIGTANDYHPRVWPDDDINKLRNAAIYSQILVYASIGVLAYLVSYNVVSYMREKSKAKKQLENAGKM